VCVCFFSDLLEKNATAWCNDINDIKKKPA